jgi:hypothetical protein
MIVRNTTFSSPVPSAKPLLLTIQIDVMSLEKLIDQSLKDRVRLLKNQKKNIYITAIFQVLLLLTLISSFLFLEWVFITRILLIFMGVCAVIDLLLFGRGFGALIGVSLHGLSRREEEGDEGCERYIKHNLYRTFKQFCYFHD